MEWIRPVIRWIILMLLQVLLINNLQFFGLCHPYIYIFSLLVLPITLPRWADLLLGACMGLIMDVFCNSLGVHMAACTLIMFLRSYFLNLLVPNQERMIGEIGIHDMGVAAFVKYVLIMVPIYHIVVFSLAAWSTQLIWLVLLETVVSSLVSCVLLIGGGLVRNR